MDTRIEKFAEEFAQAARETFIPIYGHPRDASALNSVFSSWSKRGVDLGWHEPDPRVVLVLTEYSWIRDPWGSAEDHQRWELVAESLSAGGWGNVHWDSINPAVHNFYIDMPSEWSSVLIKRAIARGSRI